jgi:hypothetical protein
MTVELEKRAARKRTVLLLALCLAVFAALWVVYAAAFFWNSIDDAYITLRYAENWAAGHGPVYNVGEPVEGYTNFGWLAPLTFFIWLGIPAPLAAKALAGLCGAATLLVGYLLGRRLGGRERSGLLVAALLAVDGSLIYWSTAGLEGPALALCLSAAFYLYLGETGADGKGRRRELLFAGLLFGYAFLLRPDAALFGAAALGGLWRRGPDRRHWPLFALALVLLPALQTAFRLMYYGEWLPNTFHAKAALNGRLLWRGVVYLGRFLLSHLPLILAALFCPWREKGRRVLPLVGGVVLYWLYLALIGGDWMAHRLFVPTLPLLAVPAALGLERAAAFDGARRWRPALVVTAALVAQATLTTLRGELVENVFQWRHNEVYHHNIGRWLAEVARPGDTLAVTPAGTVPYLTGLYTIDMLGLTDPLIAREGRSIAGYGVPGHERFDNDYVLARRPTWIMLNLLPPQLQGGKRNQLENEADLLRRPGFWREYTLINPPVQGNCLFHRRDDHAGLAALPPRSWRSGWNYVWPRVAGPVELPPPPPPPR